MGNSLQITDWSKRTRTAKIFQADITNLVSFLTETRARLFCVQVHMEKTRNSQTLRVWVGVRRGSIEETTQTRSRLLPLETSHCCSWLLQQKPKAEFDIQFAHSDVLNFLKDRCDTGNHGALTPDEEVSTLDTN